MAADQIDCALDLVRRLPPSQIEDNLAGLIDLVPDLTEQLLSAVDQPLKIAHDAGARKDYLLCDYNRDGDSYRSPWSNAYDPPLDDGAVPSAQLRQLELQMNETFDIYRELYYEGGVSSVYAWDLDAGFAACILIKKSQDTSKKGQPMKGTWDAIHVVEVRPQGKMSHYKLTSTIMLSLDTKADAIGTCGLAGSLTRQAEQECACENEKLHVINIGRMVEDMELKLRNTIEFIYFGKTKDVFNELRNQIGVAESAKRKAMQQGLAKSTAK